jgi:amino acid transporter
MDIKRLKYSLLLAFIITIFFVSHFLYFVCGSDKSDIERDINRLFNSSYTSCYDKLILNINLLGLSFAFFVTFIIFYYMDSKILKFLHSKTAYFRTNKHKKSIPKFTRNLINSLFWSIIIFGIIMTIFINALPEEPTVKAYIFIVLLLSSLYSFLYAVGQLLDDYLRMKKRKKKRKEKSVDKSLPLNSH